MLFKPMANSVSHCLYVRLSVCLSESPLNTTTLGLHDLIIIYLFKVV